MPLLGSAKKMYAGTLPAKKIYMGDKLVWSSGWRPDSIAGLVTWLDAPDYTTGSWPNKGSGPAVTIVNAPAPTVSVNTLNGLPVVRFKTDQGKVRSTWPYPVRDYTLIYLVRWVGPGVGRAFSVQYPPSNYLVGMHTSQPDAMYDNGTWLTPGTSWSAWNPPPGPWKMYGADQSDLTQSRFFIGGTLIGSHTVTGGDGFLNGWYLSGYDAGTSETLDVEVAELLIWNRKLSDSERLQAETYLGKKWNLPGYWTPADIPGLGLWLEADKITDAVDGGPITTWPDASGQGHHATPVAAAPKWQQAGLNGKPTVKFNNSRLLIPGWGTALTGKADYTLFQVISQTVFGDYPVITTAPTTGAWNWLTEFSNEYGVYWGHANGNYVLYNTAMVPGAPTLLTYSLELSGGPKLFKNGVQVAVGATSALGLSLAVPSVGPDVLFGAYFSGIYPLDDRVAAMIWYDHFLIDSERIQVENYLKSKYGIA